MSKKMGESEGGGVGKSRTPEEIEEGIISTPTVTWDPFTLFPKEIYLEIFKKLENATDKVNFMNAHCNWYDLFKAERVRFLFGKMIDDLPLENELTEGTDRSLTRLRLVCQEWDRGIQNYYQLHPDHFEFVFCEDAWKNSSKHLKQQYSDGYLVEIGGRNRARLRARQLQTDFPQFTASHPVSRNPILTRKISIRIYGNYRWDWRLGEFWSQGVDTFMDTYGHHIWHVSIRSEYEFTPRIYKRIIYWLQRMPELKTLQLNFLEWETVDKRDAANFYGIQMETPRLRKLQNLHVSNFPTYAFNKLLEEVMTVEKLEVDIKAKPGCYLRLREYQLPANLTEAAVTITGNGDFRHLSSLDQFPLLRKLIINLESGFQRGGCVRGDYLIWTEWSSIWNIIEEKFPALEDFHLSLPGLPKGYEASKRRAMEQSLDCKLNLIKLKRLSLLLSNLSSLDFLQEMKGLRELKIHLKDLQENKLFKGSDNLIRRERIHFNNRGLDTMWESNIWEIFPKLKKLSIHAVVIRGNQRVIEVHSYEKRAGQVKVYNKT